MCCRCCLEGESPKDRESGSGGPDGGLGHVVAAVMEKRRKSRGQADLQTKEQLGRQVWLWPRTMPATFALTADPGGPCRPSSSLGWELYFWADNFGPAGLQGARVPLTGASAGVGEELACHCLPGLPLVLTAARRLSRRRPLDFLVLNPLGAAPAGPRALSAHGASRLRFIGSAPCLHLLGLPPPPGELPEAVCPRPSPAPILRPSSHWTVLRLLQQELVVQDVDVAVTICVLGLQDRASAKEGVRGVTRTKAALVVTRGGAMRDSPVFYPWASTYCLLRAWLPHPRAWFIRQELNVTATAAA